MNLFELFVKIGVDDQASDKISNLSNNLSNGLKTAAKIGVAAVGAASAGVAALTKSSIDGYAEYEQLVGGVETLFKQSADVVQQYAANSYKTAGMSANEYMETVTSFSASLLQSLDGDTAAAAEKANLAITDMSDNANKMGTSMEMIQNAYQGFAKQNYTMLDNLKLGYGGTKEEMQRLLDDAEKLSGQKFDLSSYGDIVDAIHVVQTKMKITGTTAKEASTTISGSVSSMKSAWQNLVTGIADDNADLDTLIGNFVQSAETAADNIIPRLTQILSGMGSAIEQLAPVLADEIPGLITSVLPSLVSAGTQLVVGLTSGLIGALPNLIAAVPGIIESFANAISENSPSILASGITLLSMFTSGVNSAVPEFIENLPQIVDGFLGFITEKLPDILDKGVELLDRFAFGIIEYIPDLVAQLPAIINSITEFFVENFPKIVKKGGELLGKLLAGIIGAIPEIAVQLPAIITAIVDALEAGWDQLKNAGKYLLEGLWEGISDKVEWLKGKVSGVVNTIKEWFTGKDGFDEHSPSRVFATIGEFVIEGLAIGMENSKGEVMETAKDIIDDVKERFNSLPNVLTAIQDQSAQESVVEDAAALDKFSQSAKNAFSAFEGFGDSLRDVGELIGSDIVSGIGEMIDDMTGGANTVLNFAASLATLKETLTALKEAMNALKASEGVAGIVSSLGNMLGIGAAGATAGTAVAGTAGAAAAGGAGILAVIGEVLSGPVGWALLASGAIGAIGLGIAAATKNKNVSSPSQGASNAVDYRDIQDAYWYGNNRAFAGYDFSTDPYIYRQRTSAMNYYQQRMHTQIERLTDLVQEYLPQTANMQMVLDDGTLVGALTTSINSQLGQLEILAERGNI